jgi:hypothetical protein
LLADAGVLDTAVHAGEEYLSCRDRGSINQERRQMTNLCAGALNIFFCRRPDRPAHAFQCLPVAGRIAPFQISRDSFRD